jgi:glycosyltransferase involved in cell wall biosynthesis
MKIVYTFFSNLVCGGHIEALQQATRLAARGHEVAICLLDETSPASKEVFQWFPNFSLPVFHPNQFPEDVDINVATFWATALPVFTSSAKHKAYFVQLDETKFYDDEITKSKVLFTYLLNFHYMTEARWVIQWLHQNFGRSAAYIRKGFDPTIVYPTTPIEPKKPGQFRILVEGSITSPFKRVKEAIIACQNLGCEIWCVSNLGQLPPDLKVDRFFSNVSFDQMSPIYSSCDILVKLSSVEGVFAPPLEMMACGGVSVVSDVSGYDEYITHEYNALVVPDGDIGLAREAIIRLMKDPDLYAKLRQNGQLTAESMAWEPSIDKLEEFFQEIVTNDQFQLSPDLTVLHLLTQLNHHFDHLENLRFTLQRSKVWRLVNFWIGLRDGKVK